MKKGAAIFGSSFFGFYTYNHQILLSLPLLDINVFTYLFGLQDELDTHSKPETISIFVHYGGDRTNDPKAIAEHAVVLTTYGVLTSSYKKVIIPSKCACY